MKLRIQIKEVRYRMRGVPQERWKASFLVNGRAVGNLTGYKSDIDELIKRISPIESVDDESFIVDYPEEGKC